MDIRELFPLSVFYEFSSIEHLRRVLRNGLIFLLVIPLAAWLSDYRRLSDVNHWASSIPWALNVSGWFATASFLASAMGLWCLFMKRDGDSLNLLLASFTLALISGAPKSMMHAYHHGMILSVMIALSFAFWAHFLMKFSRRGHIVIQDEQADPRP